MATLTLDEVDPALVRRLHDRAAAEGVSAQELHRRILARALGEPRAANMAQAFRRLGELGFELRRPPRTIRADPRRVLTCTSSTRTLSRS